MAAFTNNEKFLMEIILNLPGRPDTDWSQVMTAMGMGSLGGTRNKFRLLEKSYLAAKAAQASQAAPTAPAAPAASNVLKPPKKSNKRKAADTNTAADKKTKIAAETSTDEEIPAEA